MNKFTCFMVGLLSFFIQPIFCQEIISKLEETYDKPEQVMWVAENKYFKTSVEKGVYISSGGDLPPRLSFGHRLNQLNCDFVSDIDFSFLRLKVDKEAFTGIETRIASTTLKFQFTGEGRWQLLEDNHIVRSGTTSIPPDAIQLSVKHRKELIEFYVNGKMVIDWEGSAAMRMNWYETKLYSESKKSKIGLDKVVFTGYFDEINEPLNEYVLQRFSSVRGARSARWPELFLFSTGTGKYKFMDKRGRVIPGEYDEISVEERGSLVRVKDKSTSLYGYVDLKGQLVVPIELLEAASRPCIAEKDCPDDWYKVKDKEGKELFIDATGKKQVKK